MFSLGFRALWSMDDSSSAEEKKDSSAHSTHLHRLHRAVQPLEKDHSFLNLTVLSSPLEGEILTGKVQLACLRVPDCPRSDACWHSLQLTACEPTRQASAIGLCCARLLSGRAGRLGPAILEGGPLGLPDTPRIHPLADRGLTLQLLLCFKLRFLRNEVRSSAVRLQGGLFGLRSSECKERTTAGVLRPAGKAPKSAAGVWQRLPPTYCPVW